MPCDGRRDECHEQGMLQKGGFSKQSTYSRSSRHLRHILGELPQARKLSKPSDSTPILYSIAQELAQHLYLLDGEEVGRRSANDGG